MMPAHGRGLVAGSSVRPVLELAGITNIVAKVHSGSKNGLNNARAAVEALKNLKA
jgi:small subunit ribosomal protein S5